MDPGGRGSRRGDHRALDPRVAPGTRHPWLSLSSSTRADACCLRRTTPSLRASGLEYIRQLSGRIWTDHNAARPGHHGPRDPLLRPHGSRVPHWLRRQGPAGRRGRLARAAGAERAVSGPRGADRRAADHSRLPAAAPEDRGRAQRVARPDDGSGAARGLPGVRGADLRGPRGQRALLPADAAPTERPTRACVSAACIACCSSWRSTTGSARSTRAG